ncbi:MAG: protein-tyrosine-phosphatase [Vicingaceae bacterium]
MFASIQQVIDKIDVDNISDERKKLFSGLILYIQEKREEKAQVLLNFICTHNSRRSQFAQLWAKVAADYYHIPVESFSGGVEITAFNERAINSLKRFGFKIKSIPNGNNPYYFVSWKEEMNGLKMFSKTFDDPINPKNNFAAIMTCSHADENCPFVAGCEVRIPIRYEDPKNYDDTPLEQCFYDYRSFEIATEMFYVFSKIKK